MNALDLVTIAAFASLAVELLAFPIPSEASTLQLLTSRAEPSPATTRDRDALQTARARPVAAKLLVYLLPTAIGVVLFLSPLLAIAWPDLRTALFPWALPAGPWLGIAAIATGRTVTFTSVLQLRAARRRQALPAGLFRHSRNPGLVGMYVFYLGLCLGYGGPWLWLGAPLYVVNMHRRVLLEEARLRQTHGAAWRDYTQSAARYLPLPGLRR